jgi:CheY-like chemotaxis protein/HPt (histidine-containing phosphotransfer) domain-containing protein
MQSTKRQRQEALPSLDRVRILLVEDGDTNRQLIGLVLRRAGAQVTMAENGRVGADLGLKDPFDLILMDMQMPVMDGYTAATLLRQEGVTVPIIALTAHAMKGDEDKCRAAGCSSYLTKPIDADLLVRTVAEMLPESFRPRPAAEPVGPASRRLQDAAALFSNLATDDPDFRGIVEAFIKRLHEQLAAMQRAAETRDLVELGRLTHWLKGAGGTAGFPDFTQPARRLESLVKDQQCDEIEAAVAELLGLAGRVALAPEGPVADARQ